MNHCLHVRRVWTAVGGDRGAVREELERSLLCVARLQGLTDDDDGAHCPLPKHKAAGLSHPVMLHETAHGAHD